MNPDFNITEKNFLLYAIHEYDNPCVNTFEEFVKDIRHVKLIKRLLGSYERSGKINIRLLLNHIIYLHNVFNTKALCKILFFKLHERYYPQIKTCLVFLDYLPEIVSGIDGGTIKTVKIPLDLNLVNEIRNMQKRQ